MMRDTERWPVRWPEGQDQDECRNGPARSLRPTLFLFAAFMRRYNRNRVCGGLTTALHADSLVRHALALRADPSRKSPTLTTIWQSGSYLRHAMPMTRSLRWMGVEHILRDNTHANVRLAWNYIRPSNTGVGDGKVTHLIKFEQIAAIDDNRIAGRLTDTSVIHSFKLIPLR